MPLVFGDEVTTNYIKFNAKDCIWSNNNAAGEVAEIEPPRMVIDLENLQTGYFLFLEGVAPDIILDVAGEASAVEPEGGNHKRGFRCSVFSTQLGVREFSSCSWMLKKAIKALYTDFEKDKDAHPGHLPIVDVVRTITVNGKYGTIYQPVFAIVGWTPRPDELGGDVEITAAPSPIDAAQANTPLADELDDSVPY
jgi:hypothetical protein